MEQLLKELLCNQDEIEWLIKDLEDVRYYNIERIINLFKKYGCSNSFIKEVLFNHKRIFKIEFERIVYLIEAILANGDIIEETLLELV